MRFPCVRVGFDVLVVALGPWVLVSWIESSFWEEVVKGALEVSEVLVRGMKRMLVEKGKGDSPIFRSVGRRTLLRMR